MVAFCQYNSFNHWGWLEDVPCISHIEVVTGDIRDPHFCLGLTRDIDIVFHLAALIPIPYSYRAPDSYVDTNVKGTLNLCQAATQSGVQRFIQTSTSEVYGTARYVPIDEHHPLTPQSPYSASKIGADAIALSFWYSFNLPVVIARPFNTYGPRQSARAIIPTIISQIASGAPRFGSAIWSRRAISRSSRTRARVSWQSPAWKGVPARSFRSARIARFGWATCSS